MAPIIRTCSLALLILGATSAEAAKPKRPTALMSYVQARVADVDGQGTLALKAYSAALAAEPGNEVVALRALREAVDVGDRAVAISAAEALATADALPADGALLLVGSRLQRGDVAGASRLIDRLEKDEELVFLLPVLRGWVALADKKPNPETALGEGTGTGLGVGATLEQRAFIELMGGKTVEAVSLVRSAPMADGRAAIGRLTAAATLQKRGDRAGALSLLGGNDPSMAAARQMITENRPLAGAIDTPVKGLAFFYARLASDLSREEPSPMGMTLGRYARFLDPTSPFVAVAEAQALAASERNAAALAALQSADVSGPYAQIAFENRLALLQRIGRGQEAISLAQSAAQNSSRASDFVRLGDIYSREEKFSDAAAAYARALEAADKRGAPERWGLLMLRGSALSQAGDWATAKSVLREAVNLAPNQPMVLNYLGYSMLERRENIAEAKELLTRASTLRPEDAAITDSIGWAYYLTRDYDRAVTTLERAALAEPLEPSISEHLGDAYWRVGRRIEARYSWRAALLTAEEDAIPRLGAKIDMGLTDKNEAR
ncbi:MAG: tetratricopeptide repeat protein [Chakrabartia sp.]